MSTGNFLSLAVQLAAILSRLHRKGVVLGKLNPDILLISRQDDSVHLADFSRATGADSCLFCPITTKKAKGYPFEIEQGGDAASLFTILPYSTFWQKPSPSILLGRDLRLGKGRWLRVMQGGPHIVAGCGQVKKEPGILVHTP
ncbi:serine/threonine-protein kinase, partial [Moorella stamsii (nom. illeg.)]|uniref:serine/threonine-protein kinase n=1 Tax=Neomoorella stamsii TaxID=1266720 RepID=UPI00137A1CF0